jgi:fluoroacetyl-CoA thioesterase
MKPSLRAGLEHQLRFRVPLSKTVPALYTEAAEFVDMPQVFATGYLVGLLEWACMRAVRPHLDEPREMTLGTHIAVDHRAATPPGLEVVVQAHLIEIVGRRLRFAVRAHDGVDLISSGTHERCVVDRASFDAKVARKAARVDAMP